MKTSKILALILAGLWLLFEVGTIRYLIAKNKLNDAFLHTIFTVLGTLFLIFVFWGT